MRMDELVEQAQEALSGRRVFGEPIQQDGITVIPAAAVMGGGGGGGGQDDEGQEGMGGGFGLQARPTGAFVVRDGDVTWRPAVDVNGLVSTLVKLVIAVLLYRWRVAVVHARASRRDT